MKIQVISYMNHKILFIIYLNIMVKQEKRREIFHYPKMPYVEFAGTY
jgi:ABC-type oligopeptide transport system ATPase subunit